MWDQRYSEQPYAYGTAPNAFVKASLDTQKPGKILFAAEGEGRNAVYAAQQGWEVEAFDLSAAGRDKALALAKQNGCEITYAVSDALSYQGGPYDAAAFCYFHTPEQVEDCYHHLVNMLHPEGFGSIRRIFSEEYWPGQWRSTKGGHVLYCRKGF